MITRGKSFGKTIIKICNLFPHARGLKYSNKNKIPFAETQQTFSIIDSPPPNPNFLDFNPQLYSSQQERQTQKQQTIETMEVYDLDNDSYMIDSQVCLLPSVSNESIGSILNN